MTITHITERELALERENERYLKTINIQSVTIEAQQEEIAALKAQPVQEPLPHWYTVASDGLVCLCASEDDAIYEAKKADAEYPHRAPRKATRLYLAAAPVQPVQGPVAYEFRMRADWVVDWGVWSPCNKEQHDMYIRAPKLHDWHYETRALFAAPVQPVPLTDAFIVLPREMDEDLYYIVGGAMGAQSPEQCGRADGLWKQLVARADYDAKRTGGAT